MRKAVFVDRDGTINVDKNFVCKVEDFEFCPGAIDGLKMLSESFDIHVVTNQSGIGRGLYTLADVHNVHEFMCNQFRKEGVYVKGIYYCPHDPDLRCGCRKPEVGMITQIEAKYGSADYANSWFIGDKKTDLQLGVRLGTKTALLRSRYWHEDDIHDMRPDIIADSLWAVACRITGGPLPQSLSTRAYLRDGVYFDGSRYQVNVLIQDGVESCGQYDNIERAKRAWVDAQKFLNGNEFTLDQVPVGR